MNGNPPRDRAGRYAPFRNPEPGIDLVDDTGPQPTAARLSWDSDRLQTLIDSPTTTDQVAAAHALELSDLQAAELAAPGRPFQTRLALAGRADSGCAERAARDPDPVVRAHVLQDGIGLTASTRLRLEADPSVLHARTVLGLD